ncbi:MAG TPA: EF-hand domain-containing protein [Povalibacter sp.]
MNDSSARTLSTVVLAVATACAYSLPASAGDKPGCTHEATLTQDVEGSGQLTATSHLAGAAKRFETMDSDKDGKVTAAELKASRGAESIVWANERISATEKIRELDTNKDDALTAQEYADSSQKMFNKLDVDGDGVLSAAEMPMPSKVSAR